MPVPSVVLHPRPERSSLAAALLTCSLLLAPLSCAPLAEAPGATGAASGIEGLRAAALEIHGAPRLAHQVTIYRDDYGVPHVFGRTDASAVFGYMYARAEDEFARVERSVYGMLGRASEALGPEGLGWDATIRRFGIPRRARAEYRRASPRLRELCQAAADGLNWYLDTHPDVTPAVIERFQPWHFLAQQMGMHVAYLPFAQAQLLAPHPPATTRDGSNAWAIAPSHSASGHAMLLANPHIPLDEVYEGHLRSDEGWNISGMNAYGSGLFPILGHNEHLAWTLTVNYPDVIDFYRLSFDDPDEPLAYRYDGGWRMAEQREETIRVRTETGFEERDLTILETHHGPVIEMMGMNVAVRIARIETGGLLQQWYEMSRARNLDEFRTAIDETRLIFHNIIYADVEGNIFYVYNAALPKRDPGFDWLRPVDGSDPATEWRGYHRLAELPQVLNPRDGWLQNCNSRPWSTSGSGNPSPEDYPGYFHGTDQDDPRVDMSRRLLTSRDRFTFDDWIDAAFNTRVYQADRWVPQLAVWLAAGDEATRDRLAGPMTVLENWDRRAAVDSTGTTLFMLWFEGVFRAVVEGTLERGAALSRLGAVADDLEKRFGDWQVPWGEVNRHQRPDADGQSDDRESLPLAGAHGGAGIMFTFLARTPEGQKRRYGYHGHSYVGAFELGRPMRARTVVPFGASRDPASPHYLDQAPLYAAGRLKAAWFSGEEVRDNARRAYHPGGG